MTASIATVSGQDLRGRSARHGQNYEPAQTKMESTLLSSSIQALLNRDVGRLLVFQVMY